MALILKDRVKETTTVTSTGTATLLGAATGYQSFSAIGNGNTCYYTIASQTANEWEVGLGTYTSPDQLSRDTVLESSNSGSLVNFSAGTKDVFVTQPAEKAVYADASNIVNALGNGSNTIAFASINTSNITANTATITAGTVSSTPVGATDLVNKTYVDALVASGIHFHDPVRVESPINLNATYNNGTAGVGATLTNAGTQAALVIDGVTVSVADRVLVYEQTNQTQNGVYVVTNVGSGSTNWILTRSDDTDTYGFDSPEALSEGSTFFVQQGATGAGETYTCNTVGVITFGTTNITFAQISSAQIYSAGTGLTLSSTTFSITNTAVTAATYGNAGQVPQIAVNAQGQITSASNVSINASSITLGTLDNARTTAASANGASTIVARDANGNFTANVITATTSNATTFNGVTVNGTTGAFGSVSGNGVALTAINASNVTSGTLANARTTASDANGASTIVSRDANGSFGANIVTATFSGNGATLSAINASNISTGTIDNARTTAASANGASTIVARDSGGSFTANTGTFTSVSGNGIGLTAINASNIASGTIANARTTASSSNGSSTIVLRGSSGEFAAGAITGASFSGNGSAITAINASAITTGTIDNARTTASSANGASTIVARDAGGNFSANTITATTFSGAHSGNGASLTNINASNISSGTIANARTTAATANGASTIVLRGTSGEFSAGAITGASFTGDGAAISNTNASNLSAGTVANARTTAASANGASTIVARDASGNFSANNPSFTRLTVTPGASGVSTGLTVVNGDITTYRTGGTTGVIYLDNTGNRYLYWDGANYNLPGGNVIATGFSGPGIALTSINASNISSGTIANARTTAASANGASTIVTRDANGSFAGNVITGTTGTFTNISGNGVSLTAINASNITSGTIANARTTAASANGASTIVTRDASGDFSARTITANLTGTASSATNASTITGVNTVFGISSSGQNTSLANKAGPEVTSQGGGGAVWSMHRPGVFGLNMGLDSDNIFRIGGWSAAANRLQMDMSGNLTMAGSVTATTFTGNGAAISAINASNLSSGTVASARISGSYTGITGVGTLSAGVWQGTSISTTYTDAKVTSVNGSTGAVTVAAGQFFGTAAVKAIAYNSNTIGENLTVTTGNNGLSAGPVTISSGFTVTVQSGAAWVIV
jgi:hypothetical protein